MILRVFSFYLLTLLFTFLLGGLQQASGISPYLSIPQFGPALSALAMLLIFRKDKFRLNFSFKDIKLKSAALSIILPFAAAAVVLLFRPFWQPDDLVPATLPPLLFLWVPFGALGEEIGWRGYLHKSLNPKLAGWLSSLIVGVLWTFFHVQSYGNGIGYMIFLMIVIISYSFVLYVLMRWSRFNIWIAALFHAAINYANVLYFDSINETRLMMVNAAVWVLIALVFFFIHRDKFFSKSHQSV
jgi:membrane protease YdiL (CAAX protease family)